MAEYRIRARDLVLESALWFMGPVVFLAGLVHSQWLPTSAVLPHLRLVAVVVLAVATVRLLLARVVRHSTARLWLGASVTAAALTVMLLYYVLVAVGLSAWGRVVSWPLIRTYGAELPALAETQGLSLPVLSVGLVFGVAVAVVSLRTLLARIDWVTALAQRLTPAVWLAFVLGGAAAVGLAVTGFIATPSTDAREPVSLTFFPEQASRNLQGHALDRVQVSGLDRAEDVAWSAYPIVRPERPINVVLVVVDALRPDHLGPYGYQRPTTPFLSELDRAGRLRRVDLVHATCGDSACGLLSLASSRFLHQLPTRPITLQQVLRRAGYRVNMILSGDHTNFYGLRESYGEVDSYHDGATTTTRYMNDDRLVLDAVAALPRWDGTPTMFQFHLMSSHVLGKRLDPTPPFPPGRNYTPAGRRQGPQEGAFADQSAVDYYDNGVVQADRFLRDIRNALSEKGYLDRALLVITADHGEALGEHGRYVHANDVREQALRIPLMFEAIGYQSPAFAAARRHATQVDIAPTVLREVGLPLPSTWKGKPLQEAQGLERAWFQQSGRAGLFDLSDPPRVWKYWINLRDGIESVFDIATDPMELDDAMKRVDPARLAQWRVETAANATNEHGASE